MQGNLPFLTDCVSSLTCQTPEGSLAECVKALASYTAV